MARETLPTHDKNGTSFWRQMFLFNSQIKLALTLGFAHLLRHNIRVDISDREDAIKNKFFFAYLFASIDYIVSVNHYVLSKRTQTSNKTEWDWIQRENKRETDSEWERENECINDLPVAVHGYSYTRKFDHNKLTEHAVPQVNIYWSTPGDIRNWPQRFAIKIKLLWLWLRLQRECGMEQIADNFGANCSVSDFMALNVRKCGWLHF